MNTYAPQRNQHHSRTAQQEWVWYKSEVVWAAIALAAISLYHLL